MITLLKNLWSLYDGEKQRQEQQQQLDKEQRYLADLIAKEENEQKLASNTDASNVVVDDAKPKLDEITTTNCYKRNGIITALNSNNGTIDHVLFFDLGVAYSVTSDIKAGSQIEYLAYHDPKTDHVKVVKILQVIDNYWDQDCTTETEIEKEVKSLRREKPVYFHTHERNVLGLITERKPDAVIIDTEYKTMNVKLDSVEIEFVPKEGDRVYVRCNVQEDDHFVDKQGEILEEKCIYPARILKQEKCTVRRLFTEYAQLDDKYYVTYDVLPTTCKLNVGDTVIADLIECERGVFEWRCIKLSVSRKSMTNANVQLTPGNSKNANRPIEITDRLSCVFSNTFQTQTLDVEICNKTDRAMKVHGIELTNKKRESPVRLIDPPANESGFDLVAGGKRTIRFELLPTMFGESRETFIVNLGTFTVRRFIRLIVCDGEEAAAVAKAKESACVEEQTALVSPSSSSRYNDQRQRLYANQVWSKKNEIVPGIGLLTRRRFTAVSMDMYEVPERLRSAYLSAEHRLEMLNNIDGYFPCVAEELNIGNYTARFRVLLHLEEIEYFVNFRSYDRDRAYFIREGEYLALTIENLAEKRPSLVIGDTVRAISPWVQPGANTPDFDGIIHKVLFDRVLLKFNPGFHAKYKGEDYRLQFYFSRFGFRKMHHVTTRVPKHLGEQFLFPTRVQLRDRPQLDVQLDDEHNMHLDGRQLPWFNVRLNDIQKRAVHNILRGEVQMMPYVIFGPPGTGKTITVVETILQLVKHLPSARVLVGTPSNSSADLIATRLIDSGILHPGDFVRLVSQSSIERDIIPDHLLPYCATPDFGSDGSCENSMIVTDSGLKLRCQMKTLGRHRIIIGTCITLGNFIPMGFPATHFTHAIIDETGQCTEPAVMVPIAQISKDRGQVILAGDPNQLSAITTNRLAADRGLSMSFLERMTARPPYAKDVQRYPRTSGYDPRLVTKLLHNYRALPSILNVYNELFYDTELLAMIDERDSREAKSLLKLDTLLPSSALRAKSHGAFFYGMRSENKQESDSPSWYNPLEAKNVFLMTMRLYNKDIKPESIGIITPYSRQVKHIRMLFTAEDIAMPKIGSVEDFQGQERDIILISTVRSTQGLIARDLRHALGFVQSSKRMNVAISRARYLMFVFGNPHLLALDDCWRSYIKYCIDNDAYLGELPEQFQNCTQPEENDCN